MRRPPLTACSVPPLGLQTALRVCFGDRVLAVPQEYVGAVDDELVQVFVGPPNQAELMRSVLEGNGIEAVIRGSGASGAYPLNVGALAETNVLVAAKDVEVARQLLRPDEEPPGPSVDEPRNRGTAKDAFRRSVLRWAALIIVLMVLVASLVTTLDLG